MAIFLATLTPMLTLFLCIAVGFVIARAKILPDSAGKVMAKLETWVFCPALGFMTMMRYCTVDTLGTHGVNLALSAVSVSLAMAIAILLSRVLVKNDVAERGIYSYALAFANSGYIGDPIVLSLFGEEILSYYKLFCLPLSVLIYTWGIGVLTPKSEQKGAALKRLLNAPTIAIALGIFAGLTGVGQYMPAFVTGALDTLKSCMGPVAMLLAGITIARYDFLSMLKKKKVYLATALRLVIIPTVLIAALFGAKTLLNAFFDLNVNNNVLFLCFFATAAPLGLNTVVFPEAYGGNPETGASMAMISHTLCVISIPLLYALMVTLFGVPFAA